MPTVELIFRMLAVGQLGLLVPMLLLRAAGNPSYRYAALLLFAIASYLLAPLVLHEWQWGFLSSPIIFLAIILPALFWYFSAAVFSDNFSPHPSVIWLVLATGVIGMLAFCGSPGQDRFCPQTDSPVFGTLSWASKAMWIASAFYLLLKDWRADLVEPRRRLRRLIVIAGGCYIGAVVTTELFLPDPAPANLELLNTGLLLAVITVLCFHFMGVNDSNVFAQLAPATPQLDPQSSGLAQELVDLMTQERAHAMEALTINSLAERLRTQPYQLRQVINSELGFRNFNAFINLYRIQEVAQRLALDEYSDTPLLTLALDAGFRSLAPFNRSFKDHFGVTPSEYRQKLTAGK